MVDVKNPKPIMYFKLHVAFSVLLIESWDVDQFFISVVYAFKMFFFTWISCWLFQPNVFLLDKQWMCWLVWMNLQVLPIEPLNVGYGYMRVVFYLDIYAGSNNILAVQIWDIKPCYWKVLFAQIHKETLNTQ